MDAGGQGGRQHVPDYETLVKIVDDILAVARGGSGDTLKNRDAVRAVAAAAAP